MSIAIPLLSNVDNKANRAFVEKPISRIPDFNHTEKVFEQKNHEQFTLKPSSSQVQNFAEWICSRESLFRFGLDITGWVAPSLIGAATRNKYSFYEELFRAGLEFAGMGLATQFAQIGNYISGALHLKPEENKGLKNYMLFHLNDLDSEETMMKAASRLKEEEVSDLGFIQAMDRNKGTNAEKYSQRAEELKNFFENFKTDSEQINRLKKFKKGTIIIDSFLEGIIWGGYFLFSRLFRKHVLKQDRFTGTKAYANDEQSKKIGDSTPLSFLQKCGIGTAMTMAPVMNWRILKLLDNKKLVEKSSWLQLLKQQWDMTHGIYPKLGLMVSYLWLPVTIGGLASAQGRSEFIEQLLTQTVMSGSWFFGHRATNGVLAKFYDNWLAKKHSVAPGIMVEKDYLHHPLPEPAKIQHIIKATQGNAALQNDARKAHSNTLLSGFALHSGLVLLVRLLINKFTQWHVGNELKSN